jgi:signal transduction histidine kinase
MPHVYNEYAFNYLNVNNYDEALRYALKADSIVFDTGTINICYTKGLLASIYLHRNDYERAMQYAKEALEQAELLKAINLYMNARRVLSDIYLAQKRYPEAEAEAFNAWRIDTTNVDESRALVKNIALANIHLYNTEKAAYYLQKYSELNAQYTEKSFHTTVSDLTIKYETDKKEALIKSLVRERRLYYSLGISGILMAISLTIAIVQLKRNMRKKQQLAAEKAVKNGEIAERARLAKDLHDVLGGSLTSTKYELNRTQDPLKISYLLDKCITELYEIINVIMPRSLQLFGLKGVFENISSEFPNVVFHFHGEEKRLNLNLEYTIYCCARELINNAMKYSKAQRVNVQIVQSRKYITLTIQDDGCGFDEKSIKSGHGLQNIRNRVAAYKGKIDIASTPGEGTEALIAFKIESQEAQNKAGIATRIRKKIVMC